MKSQFVVRQIGDTDKPVMVDPASVGCGFLLFPKQMAGILQESHVHQALQTNKTKLWEVVRRHNPRIPVYLMTTNQEIEPGDAVTAFDQAGKYPGYSIALDPMQMSPDGGRTFVTVYVGFNWKSSHQEVIVAGPQKILPGKPEFSGNSKWWLQTVFGAVILFLMIAFTAYLAFNYAPIEKSMGVIQKIFYLHISCAFSAFVAFGTCFYANLRYVFTREPKSDWLGVSSAEVGLAFITVVLVTGPIWAHPVWGIWWTWDARLTLTFVLGLLYLSYLLLRSMIEEPDKRALFSALFGIFAFLDVPLVYFSIRWWRTQHPQPVILGGPGSGLEPRMRVSYLLMWGALTGLLILLLSARYKLEALRAGVEDLRRETEVR